VIAEGIETSGQRAYLNQFGCEFGKGFFFSPPVDSTVLQELLTSAYRNPVEARINTDPQSVPAI